MPIINQPKNGGLTVSKLAEIFGNMAKEGHGNLLVCIDLGDGRIAPAGRGDIGIASDMTKVLVIRRGTFNTQLEGIINGQG